MKNLILFSLILTIISPLSARAFNRPVTCTGTTQETSRGGERVRFTFELNKDYERTETRVYNSHRVTLEYLDSWFGSTKTHFHGDMSPLCWAENPKTREVECHGYGVGNGMYEFKLLLNRRSMTATTVYKIYVTDIEYDAYEFTERNPLICR